MTCYGAFCRPELYPPLRRINTYLMRWLMNRYKKHRTWKKAIRAWSDAAAAWPRYFAHWADARRGQLRYALVARFCVMPQGTNPAGAPPGSPGYKRTSVPPDQENQLLRHLRSGGSIQGKSLDDRLDIRHISA